MYINLIKFANFYGNVLPRRYVRRWEGGGLIFMHQLNAREGELIPFEILNEIQHKYVFGCIHN